MFSRACFTRLWALEAALGESELETERADHASSGPCDKCAIETTRIGQSSSEQKIAPEDILYIVYCPKGSLEVFYEAPTD